MQTPRYFVGIDIASLKYFAAVGIQANQEWQLIIQPKSFDNDYDSLPKFLY